MTKEYSIIIPTIRLDLAKEAQQSMLPFESIIRFSETKAHSFSRLVNECIVSAPSEYVIICADKGRPTAQDVEQTLCLISEGYGIVGLFSFGFFGFKKDLIRKIGFFDERYVGGGFEDWDMIIRLKEANIAYYEKRSINFLNAPSTWKYAKNLKECPAGRHLTNKWGIRHGDRKQEVNRFLKEEKYKYDIGPQTGSSFLNWSHSLVFNWRGYV
jgi:hypothetical protein